MRDILFDSALAIQQKVTQHELGLGDAIVCRFVQQAHGTLVVLVYAAAADVAQCKLEAASSRGG